MPALITTLIDKVDNSEAVRDQIAAILLLEQAHQQALATAAHKDPALWALQVFVERSNPWADFIDSPDVVAPVVNVCFDNWTADKAMGNVVSRQQVLGTFNIDIYGYGKSASDGGAGHVPGDERASLECQRGARLVRNILLGGAYAYLGLQGVVGSRWPASLTMLNPSASEHPLQHVVAARLALQVSFNEFSPQVEGVPLALLSLQVLRKSTGQLLLRTDFDTTTP